MATDTTIVKEVTYSPTTSGSSITLLDGDYAFVASINKLAEAIERLRVSR